MSKVANIRISTIEKSVKMWKYGVDFLWILRGRMVVMAFIRKFKTLSGATGVQVCWKQNGEVVKTVHVGSANSEIGLKKLLKKAQKIKDEGKRSLFDLSDYDS